MFSHFDIVIRVVFVEGVRRYG